MERKKLSDILRGNADVFKDWKSIKPAEEFKPLPPGDYVCRILSGELFASKSQNTPGYKLTFEVMEGEHQGRKFWYDIWLTEKAKSQARRDLDKLGITDPATQLEQPLPQGMIAQCKVTLRREDDGNEYNRVRSFDVLRVEEPVADPFAPQKGGQSQ